MSSRDAAHLRRVHHRPSFLPTPPLFDRRPFSFPFFAPNTCRSPTGPATLLPCASLHPTNPATQYVPLHVHSDFSLLDGASQLPSLVQRAEELGVPALALTDHGVLYGAVQLVRNCRSTSVKPIIGNEMYVVNDDLSPMREPRIPAPKRYHLIVLAKNTTGYRNLVKLTTMAHLSGKVGKGIFARPCINKAQLFQHREGLIVSSACLGGEIAQAILNDDIDAARLVATWFRDVFGDDFYLEIQDHGSVEDKKVNPVMLQLSDELGINVIATNDSHFTSCLDAEAHDAMICIQTGKLLTDDNRLHYAGNEYFKSIEEMRKCFVDHLPLEAVDKALINTIGVAAKVEPYDLFGATRIPEFPVPVQFSHSHDEYLRHVSQEGLERRLETRCRSGLIVGDVTDAYHSRLGEELDMICRMGFSSYFLVVWDYIKHARELGIPVGPGRGSAAGSLVAFALRITDVDPMAFNLLFERFLNPERKSMPDIDTDFSVQGRERVISYVSKRYGRDRVAQIITFNRLTSKAVLKDVARVHSVPYSEADRLAKLIPVVRGKPATLSKLLSVETPSPDFKRMIEKNPSYQGWLDKAQRIEGANKTFGIHAAGVVISASPLTDIVPLSKARHGETITQYAMEDVEALGLLKMDFLGLKNLTIIETALKFINEGRRHMGIADDLDFSVDELPLNDAKTYKLLAEGELDGIFQLDASGGMRSIVRELRPSSLEDISSILALYRPGPLDAGLIPKFIRRKHGIDPIEYEHPLLEPILKETYGIMVYQEQIMRIARDLAGYSLGQADILRRAMGKKKTEDMEREKPKFVEGAMKNGVSQKIATSLFDQMLKFAEYCFNKSHSTAYAFLTYQTAYLKANYPVEYCAAVLRANMNQSDKLVRYLADARALGVRVLPPSANRSELGFTVDRSDTDEAVVLFGLEAVKTVGESVSTALIEEREANGRFFNIIDLIERVNLRVLNKRAMGSLIQAGAFDELHPNRKVLHEQLDKLLVLRRKLRDKRKRRETKGMSDEEREALDEQERIAWEDAKVHLAVESRGSPDFDFLERLAGEKATLGFYASGNPLHDLQDVTKMLGCTPVSHIIGEQNEEDGNIHDVAVDDDEEVETLPSVRNVVEDGTQVMILSCVTDLKRLTTARGKKMGKWMIEDAVDRIPAVVFPGAYEIMEQVLPLDGRKPLDLGAGAETDVDRDAESNEPEDEPRYVVEEDARVVVWGKVSRESSGSAQIIVDDVQRVEDVNFILATSRYDRTRDAAVNAHILRRQASKVLKIDLGTSAVGTFIDKNGEVRRRRASKAPPISQKNRLPLVLEYLGEDGNPISYVNVGNQVRFPSDCSDHLETLQKLSGFEIRHVSVSKDLMNNDSVDGTPEELALPSTDEALGNIDNKGDAGSVPRRDSSSQDETTGNEIAQPGKEEGDTQDNVIQDAAVTLDEKRRTPFNEELVEGGEDIFAGTATRQEFLDENEPEELPIRSGGTSEDASVDQVGSPNTDLPLSASERDRVVPTSESTKIRGLPMGMNWAESDLISSRLRFNNRDPFNTQSFAETSGFEEYAVHDAFDAGHDDNGETGPVKVTPKSVTSVANAPMSLDAPEKDLVSRDVGILELERTDRLGHNGGDDSLDGMSFEKGCNASASSNTSVRGVSAANGLGQDLHESVLEKVSTSVERSGASIMRRVPNDTGVDDIVKKSAWKVRNVLTQPNEALMGSEREAVPVSISNEDIATGRSEASANESEEKALNLSDGVVVHFDDVKLAGVVDAVCLVAGDVGRKYGGGRRHVICGITELNMEKLREAGVSMHLQGRVVYAHERTIYIIVDMRETTPSGKRKRVRSFGPVVVMLKTEDEVETRILKTKKETKGVETLVQKVQKYCRDEQEEHDSPAVSTGSSSPNSSALGKKGAEPIIHVNAFDVDFATAIQVSSGGTESSGAGLLDGGEITSYMTRAAEVCAGRAVGELAKVSVVAMDWVVMPTAVAWKSVRQVCVRTHLEGLSFGTLKVQAEAEVLDEDGHAFKFMGLFGVCCDDGRLLKRMRIHTSGDSNEALFTADDALSSVFDEAKESLDKVLPKEC